MWLWCACLCNKFLLIHSQSVDKGKDGGQRQEVSTSIVKTGARAR